MKVILNEKKVEKLGLIASVQNPKGIQSLLNKVRNAYKSKFEKTMTAITFAEAGEFDIAEDILGDEKT